MPIQIITNVEPEDAATLKEVFLEAGATSVTEAPEPDGQVSLIVVYPEEAHPMPLVRR